MCRAAAPKLANRNRDVAAPARLYFSLSRAQRLESEETAGGRLDAAHGRVRGPEDAPHVCGAGFTDHVVVHLVSGANLFPSFER